MNPLAIIETYYAPNTALYELLVLHSRAVADKALFLANQHPELAIDCKFVEEAAMLHDIGIFLTNAPSLGCYGTHRYIEHGYLGADLLRQHGLDKHALVCERHTGTGLSLADIEKQQLPLPHRDMRPVSRSLSPFSLAAASAAIALSNCSLSSTPCSFTSSILCSRTKS